MRYLLILKSICNITFVSAALKGLYEKSSYIHEISSDEKYQTYKDIEDLSIIIFYAPWCPHCQNFVTPYNNFAKVNSNRTISFAAVNCNVYV